MDNKEKINQYITKHPEFTEHQKEFYRAYLPTPSDDLSKAGKALFNAAVNKISISDDESGGLVFSYEGLNENELFALGITGTKEWPLFVPEKIMDTIMQARPQRWLENCKVILPAKEHDLVNAINVFTAYTRKNTLITAHGEKFKPAKPKGAQSTKVRYIYSLVTQHPEMSAKELFREAEEGEIEGMASGTFSNHVSKAKNPK